MAPHESAKANPAFHFPPTVRWPRALQSFLYATRPTSMLETLRKKHGNAFTLSIFGLGTTVVFADPERIKDILTGSSDTFRLRETNALLGPFLGRNSLLMVDGEHHRIQRQLMLPPFRGEVVNQHQDQVVRSTEAALETWPLGRAFQLRPQMQSIALEIILRNVIGVSDPARFDRLRELLPKLLDFGFPAMLLILAFPTLLEAKWMQYHPALRIRPEVNRLLMEEIKAHRQDPENRQDILSHLVSAVDENGRMLSDAELLDQLITLLLAGHETTATALAWVFERLTRHSEAMDRLCAEIEAGEGEAFLEAVIHESLRLRPVVANIGRYVGESVCLGPYRLPEGTRVFAAISLVHTSDFFEDSDRFRPERFLDKPPAPFTFIPFGGGVHRCIGANFAMMEMKTVVRTVLKRVSFAQTSEPSERQKAHHITLEPARGARVTVTHRLPK